MATSKSIDEVGKVIKLSSNVSRGCRVCSEPFNGHDVDDMANHYLDDHHFRVLHVGQETSDDSEGRPWQSTVIVLGK